MHPFDREHGLVAVLAGRDGDRPVARSWHGASEVAEPIAVRLWDAENAGKVIQSADLRWRRGWGRVSGCTCRDSN